MNTRLTIEVVDIDWRYCIHPPDHSYLIGASILGNFRIDAFNREAERLRSYEVTFCPDSALVPLDARKHPTIDDAKAVCQQAYRTVILSAIYLNREDFD